MALILTLVTHNMRFSQEMTASAVRCLKHIRRHNEIDDLTSTTFRAGEWKLEHTVLSLTSAPSRISAPSFSTVFREAKIDYILNLRITRIS